MIAVDFPQRNLMLAEDQPEYETLPVFVEMKGVIVPNGPGDPQNAIITKDIPWSMTCCFQLNQEEIDEIARTGRLWFTQMVFGQSFQPILMSTQNPFTNAVQPETEESN